MILFTARAGTVKQERKETAAAAAAQ